MDSCPAFKNVRVLNNCTLVTCFMFSNGQSTSEEAVFNSDAKKGVVFDVNRLGCGVFILKAGSSCCIYLFFQNRFIHYKLTSSCMVKENYSLH